MKLVSALVLFAMTLAVEPIDRAACTPCYNGYKICYDKVIVKCERVPVHKKIL